MQNIKIKEQIHTHKATLHSFLKFQKCQQLQETQNRPQFER